MKNNSDPTVATWTDEEIVIAAQAGDHDAFGEIVRRWERRVFGVAFGMLGNTEDAMDVAQETFASAYRNLSNFRRAAKVSSWLHRIAINESISLLRRRRARPSTVTIDDPEDGSKFDFADTNASPHETVEAIQRRAAVRRAVKALPIELRQVIVLKEFEDLTFQEIADTLEVPLSTIKSRLYTALKQLRMKLAGHDTHRTKEVASR